MKQKKTMEGVEQVVEEFEVYRPIVLANIWGMENVLGDRCITLILEKSNRKEVTNLIEIFNEEKVVIKTKEMLDQCSKCRCSSCGRLYKEWNNYVKSLKNYYTNNTINTNYTNYTNYTELFKSINLMDLNGRDLELSLPLCMVAADVGDDVLKTTTLTLKSIFNAKKEEELVENYDISLIDFTGQQLQDKRYIPMNQLIRNFKEFLQVDEEWINSRWLARALKRLDLVIQKRRKSYGVEVILNIEKAQKKIKMFK